jgi:hypothetical protein
MRFGGDFQNSPLLKKLTPKTDSRSPPPSSVKVSFGGDISKRAAKNLNRKRTGPVQQAERLS